MVAALSVVSVRRTAKRPRSLPPLRLLVGELITEIPHRGVKRHTLTADLE
jgi:hypothetical protein